jgi:hypothetical protein
VEASAVIIRTNGGMEIDLTEQVERLRLISRYENYRLPDNLRFVDQFCRKLVAAAGPHAPGAVIAEVGPLLNEEFGEHVASRWAEIVEEESGA